MPKQKQIASRDPRGGGERGRSLRGFQGLGFKGFRVLGLGF